MTRYLTCDVFTDAPFGGNPLAVIPDATGLPDPLLQKIAREFNYSETTFVYPPSDAAHTARVRIFTPTMEVPFAGHPVIGTAITLARLGGPAEMTFELGVGPIPVRVKDGHAAFTTRVPLSILSRPDPADVAACLGLPQERLAAAPVQAGVGLPFVMVELTDRAALSAIRTDIGAFRACAGRYPSDMDFAVLAWFRDGETIHARMFAPLDDIPEDPATGSAAAALGASLGPGRYDIHQGEDMGRPSRIRVEVAPDGAVTVSGQAVPVMSGTLEL